jgi:hypothetical protein
MLAAPRTTLTCLCKGLRAVCERLLAGVAGWRSRDPEGPASRHPAGPGGGFEYLRGEYRPLPGQTHLCRPTPPDDDGRVIPPKSLPTVPGSLRPTCPVHLGRACRMFQTTRAYDLLGCRYVTRPTGVKDAAQQGMLHRHSRCSGVRRDSHEREVERPRVLRIRDRPPHLDKPGRQRRVRRPIAMPTSSQGRVTL